MPDTRVTMIIVDELHNLDMTTRACAEASDTLKYFSERLPATFVYSGIGLDRGALLAGLWGDQVAGRFTLIPTGAFTPGQEWPALIAAIEGALRLYRHKDGTLVTLADYLHRRTRGMIGSLLWLLRDAPCQAILDGTEKITRKVLDLIAIDMTAQAPPPCTGAARRRRTSAARTGRADPGRPRRRQARRCHRQGLRALAATVRTYANGLRTPGEPVPRADDFAPFAGDRRQRLADDPHLRTPALLAELSRLGLSNPRSTLYHRWSATASGEPVPRLPSGEH